MASYLDSSAIVKLAVREPESDALRRYLSRLSPSHPLVSSALARVEVRRALRPSGAAAERRGDAVLERIDLVRIGDRVLDRAGALEPLTVRSLDAVHLATAELVRDELDALITYDKRMIEAAVALGHRVEGPG